MSKLLIGIIVAMGLSGMMYYQFSVVPMKNKLEEQTKVILAQDLRDQEQQATIEAIQNNLKQTTQALSGLQVKNQQYESQMSEYLDIFRRHNIAKLASAKPGMVELRANNRTKEAFDAFVDIVESKESSTLEKLLKYDRKLGNKRKFTKNGVDDDITEARKFFKDYVKKLTDLDKLDKAIYDQNNEIDILEGRTKIGKEFLARVMNILDAYFESTEGLVRGNDTHSPNQLSQIAKFDEKFLVQMSSIGNECEISYFKK